MSLRNYRNDFPILKRKVHGKRFAYLDSAASAQKPTVMAEAVVEVLTSGYANIHRGAYKFSQDLTAIYENVRQQVADFIGASTGKEVIFTANATDAINLVSYSWGDAHLKEGDEIIISEMEHHANIVPWQLLRDRKGIVIKVIPVKDDATLDMEAYKALLTDRTRLVSIVHASNALGTINPVEEIIKIAKTYNPDIKVLVDGSQSVVHMPINVQEMGCDFFVFTGHKLYASTGVGVLYGRYDVLETMIPFRGGGDMIDTVTFERSTYKEPPFRFEAGTPPIVQVIGLGASIDYIYGIGMTAIMHHEAELLRIGDALLSEVDDITIYSKAPSRVGIFSLNINGVHPSDIGMILDQCGVAVRTGHHCCMPLMKRLGVEGTLRASMGIYTNLEDLEQFVSGLKKAKEMLQ